MIPEAPVRTTALIVCLGCALVQARPVCPEPPPCPAPPPIRSNGHSQGARPLVVGPIPNRAMLADPRFTARLFQIRAYRIQKVLGVPEDRARFLADRWGRWDREHVDRGQQVAELRTRFNQILMSPEREEEKNARLRPLLDQFLALRTQQDAGRKQFEEEIRQGLTPAQQARLILVMDEIQQQLREGLSSMRGR
jgi:hypothetical protein